MNYSNPQRYKNGDGARFESERVSIKQQKEIDTIKKVLSILLALAITLVGVCLCSLMGILLME